jgi:predicted transcriptional regulator
MAESRISRDNYITIQGFMITDLKLKGNELIIYAVIYGFSQAENQTFSGSLQYLADWLNGTRQGVQKSLKSLIEKGFVVKTDKIVNGVKFCEYSATKGVYNSVAQCTTQLQGVYNSVAQGCTTQLHGGVQLSCTNNIKDNKKDNINIKESKKESPKNSSFDEIILEYAKKLDISMRAEITDLLQEWLKVRKAKRAAMTDRAIKMNIEKLDSLAALSGLSVPEYLREVICRGWAAFYQIKNFNSGNGQPAANIGANGIAINNAPSALDSVF